MMKKPVRNDSQFSGIPFYGSYQFAIEFVLRFSCGWQSRIIDTDQRDWIHGWQNDRILSLPSAGGGVMDPSRVFLTANQPHVPWSHLVISPARKGEISFLERPWIWQHRLMKSDKVHLQSSRKPGVNVLTFQVASFRAGDFFPLHGADLSICYWFSP